MRPNVTQKQKYMFLPAPSLCLWKKGIRECVKRLNVLHIAKGINTSENKVWIQVCDTIYCFQTLGLKCMFELNVKVEFLIRNSWDKVGFAVFE